MGAAIQADRDRNFGLAEQLYGRALTLQPSDRNVKLYRLLAIAKQQRQEEALKGLREFLREDPGSAIAANWISKILRESGRLAAALPYAEQAAKSNPRDADIAYNLGLCYFGLNRSEEAIFFLERSTELATNFTAGFYALACVYEAIGQPWQALIACQKNVDLDPFPDGFLKLGQLHLALGQTDEAIECGLNALEKPSLQGLAHLLLAEALADDNPVQSESHLREAVELSPELAAQFESSRSKRLSRFGRIEDAIPIYLKAIQADPRSCAAYLNLVTVKKVTEEDRPMISQMESLEKDGQLPSEEEIHLQFALGKSFDNLGDYERAIHHYKKANALLVEINPALSQFDREQFTYRINSLIDLFEHSLLVEPIVTEISDPRPIFIVGMMRSGTTLAEQILSCHPRVAAGGELAHWAYSEKKIVDFRRRRISDNRLKEGTKGFRDILKTICGSCDAVTDKNPANCFQLGLIPLALPDAKIVHMVRDPLETALSIFITPTRKPPEFGGNLENIVFAVQEVSRLMDHWHAVLPGDCIHQTRYEDLVFKQVDATRELLKGCNLTWDDRCLHPEQNQSLVGTPSLWQVRQPINPESIGRTQRYKTWLGADLGSV